MRNHRDSDLVPALVPVPALVLVPVLVPVPGSHFQTRFWVVPQNFCPLRGHSLSPGTEEEGME